jgi:transposase
LNQQIGQLLTQLNIRPFKKLPGCRQSLFESLDRPALKPLPREPYQYAEWKKVRVHIDYHVEVDGHYYSVPHALVKRQLDARVTAHTIECFYKGNRVASHARSWQKGRHTTVRQHMPESHRKYGDWSPQRLINWAQQSGPGTAKIIETILSERRHPEQGYRSCLGVLRLGKSFGDSRLEAACQRALLLGTHRYKSIESILKNGLDQQPIAALDITDDEAITEDHDNVRGPNYYH